MSDLRPLGVPVMVEDEERHLLFTFNAIDEIQEHFKKPLGEVIGGILKESNANEIMRFVLMTLLNDEAERAKNNDTYKIYSEKEAGWLLTLNNQAVYLLKILEAYGISLPIEEGENDPN